MDGETGVAECSIDGRGEPVDGIGRKAEEIEVARLSPNVAAGDQSSSARKREPLRLLEAGVISATCSCSGVSTYPSPR